MDKWDGESWEESGLVDGLVKEGRLNCLNYILTPIPGPFGPPQATQICANEISGADLSSTVGLVFKHWGGCHVLQRKGN